MKEQKRLKIYKEKIADVNPTLPIISLNVHGLNITIKRQRLAKGTPKNDPNKWCLQETQFWFTETNRLKVKWFYI